MLNKLQIRRLTLRLHNNPFDRWVRPALIITLLLMALAVLNIVMANFIMTGLAVGEEAPQFVGQTLDERQVDLADSVGKPVMLTFWSPDCFACREELPALQALADDPSTEMELITIVSHMERTKVEAFVAEQELTFPVIVDFTGLIAKQYKVSGIPFTYFIDQQGTIDEVVMGAGREGELQNQLFGWLQSCRIDEVCSVE